MGEWIDKVRWHWSARSFGNQIADSMAMPRTLFHRAIEMGIPTHLAVLAEIRRRGTSVVEARRLFAPIVIAGLFALLSKFGAQEHFVAAHSKLTHQFPEGTSPNAYSDAFRKLDALVKS